MTTPDPWSDERLGSAFQARAAAPSAVPPSGLTGAALAAVRSASAPPARTGRLRLLPAALVGAVALAVVGSLVLPGTTRPDPSAPNGPSLAPSPVSGRAPSLVALPVVTVADLVEAAAVGPTPVEVVVRGWMSRSSAVFRCAFMVPHPLVPDCNENQVFLADRPPDGGAAPDHPADPSEPFVVPMLRLDSHVDVSVLPGRAIEVVAIGHQSDHRWTTCPGDQANCKARFVIDRLLPAGAIPDDAIPTPWSSVAPPTTGGATPPADPEDVVVALTEAVGDLTVISIGHIDSDSLPTIEPIIDGQRGPADTIWVVRALTASRGPAIARTFLLGARSLAAGVPVITEVTETSVEPVWPVADPPSEVLGLPVISVDDALAVRDAGADDRELAVRGWFSPIAPISCPAPATSPVSPVEPNCPDQWVVLMQEPESLFTARADGAEGHLPTGDAFQIDLGGLDTSVLPGMPELGPAEPAEIVVIGHFDDRKARLCPPDVEQACRDRFIVDRVDSIDGEPIALSHVVMLDDGGPRSSMADVQAVLAAAAPDATVLSVVVADNARIGDIEPTLEVDVTEFGDGASWILSVRWVIRTLEGGWPRTYVVTDGIDEVWRMDIDGNLFSVAGQPGETPAPTEGLWPPVGTSFTVRITKDVEGRPPFEVAVVDRSGRIVSAREATGDDPIVAVPDDGASAWVAAEPGDPRSIRLGWFGGNCDRHTIVTIDSPDSILVDLNVPSPCNVMGNDRSLILTYSEPVGAGQIDVSYNETRIED